MTDQLANILLVIFIVLLYSFASTCLNPSPSKYNPGLTFPDSPTPSSTMTSFMRSSQSSRSTPKVQPATSTLRPPSILTRQESALSAIKSSSGFHLNKIELFTLVWNLLITLRFTMITAQSRLGVKNGTCMAPSTPIKSCRTWVCVWERTISAKFVFRTTDWRSIWEERGKTTWLGTTERS